MSADPSDFPDLSDSPADPRDPAAWCDALLVDLTGRWPSAETSLDVQDDAIALSFVHPVHEATAIVVAERDPDLGATILLSVVVGDWGELRNQPQGASLFLLNPRLMTGALGLLPLNDEELAVVLCRRLPIESVPVTEALELLESMMFEYAQAQGWFKQGDDDSTPAPPGATARPDSSLLPVKPRLIGSLDELANLDELD
jgi:hypothetical protein